MRMESLKVCQSLPFTCQLCCCFWKEKRVNATLHCTCQHCLLCTTIPEQSTSCSVWHDDSGYLFSGLYPYKLVTACLPCSQGQDRALPCQRPPLSLAQCNGFQRVCMHDIGLNMAQPMLPACVHPDQAYKSTGRTTKPAIVHSRVLLAGRISLSVHGIFNARPDCER